MMAFGFPSHQPSITCPFDFSSFLGHEVFFRCINPRCAGRAPDEIFAQSLGRSPVSMGRAFAGPRLGRFQQQKLLLSATCSECGQQSRTRICPHCHFELTHDAGLVDDRIIAIIGGRETGKSIYITTLISRLATSVGKSLHFGFHMVGDNARTRFETEFRKPLYVDRSVLKPTQPGDVDSRVKFPMVFRLTFDHGHATRALNLSFFDTAGEDMSSLDSISVQARYICNADGIVFLLDPLQMEAVRDRLPGARLPAVDPQSEPGYIVARLRELFERQRSLAPTAKIQTPLAFTFSKIDAVFPFIDPGSILRSPGEHYGALNLAEINALHTEITSLLEVWSPGLSNNVEHGFRKFGYFGISSLGQAPDASGHVQAVAPLRVEDPFLWILHELGLVKGTGR